MTQPETLPPLPTRRIKAADGMAVTADVWDEAHEYHRQHLETHIRLSHGAGVLTGLDVIANDPADTAVYILPGVAIDPYGRSIVLSQPLTFDVGSALEGRIYILLTYGESRAKAENGHVAEGAPMYIHAEFGVEAAVSLPNTPYVELARLFRQGRGSPLRDAADPEAPGANEIDLRFRRSVAAVSPAPAGLAVVHVGGDGGHHGPGARRLAQALRGQGGRAVWADDDVPLGPNLNDYAVVCVTAHGGFSLSADQMNALYAYVQGGGTLLLEACRRDAKAAQAADAAFGDLLSSLGLRVEAVAPGHALLSQPALFASLPAGFETEGQPELQAGGGVVWSKADYACLWNGQRRSGPATREEIRAAHEFGGNLLALADARRRQAK